ncbi:MAG: hypothetical protein SPG65_05805 [Campylobacter sp.]|nr:hypothetical protein [Campylobacter sp.]
MKKIHVIAKNWDNSYGGCGYLNSLAFYTKDDEKLEVTDVVSIGDSGAGGVTFKLNGVGARIEWFNNYGASYYPSNIFETGASYAYSILLYNMNSYALEQQGFYIYFDKDINNIAYITLLTTYYPANNFVVRIDDGDYTEPVTTVGDEVFKIPLPASKMQMKHTT